MNNSGIHPVGPRILVKPEVFEEKTASGIITTTDVSVEQAGIQVGRLVEAGPKAWVYKGDDGVYTSDPWAEVGQLVFYVRYSGDRQTGIDGEEYALMNDEDLYAVKEEIA